MVAALLEVARPPRKVLVTDFDEVLWSGVLAEDGVAGIAMGPDGKGYRHFIYQSLLLRLRKEGVLLAGVTRNSPEIVAEVFAKGGMPLKVSDFVAVLASYGAKSAQIRQLGERLNLGLDAFVFVDDNPIEVSEVSSQLPEVLVRRFPDREEALPGLIAELVADFHRETLTAEDRDRTELYRRRLEGIAPSQLSGGDLSGFLRELGMTLTIHDRSTGDRTRVVQLINKTNQFNLNGRRLEDGDVAAILAAGGRLYGASLADRSGSHGEILACLIDAGGTVRALVMSCRVFQRQVEYAFLAWLSGRPHPPTRLDFAETPRNEPFRMFLASPSFAPGEAGVALDPGRFLEHHAASLELFTLDGPEPTS
jgi:FkbH-like protein